MLVYALLLREQRKGYAFKTILKVSELLLKQCKSVKKVKAEIDYQNIPSQKVVEKAGFVTYDTEKNCFL